MSARPLVILVTGDPVANVEARRGSFATLLEPGLRQVWDGEVVRLDARRGELPVPREVGALVITGSPESVASRAPWILEAERAVAAAVDAGVPTLGVCFGHQLLAQALGGEVTQNPYGREMGTVALELVEPDELFEHAPQPFYANMSHRDSAVRLPAAARVLARSRLEPHAAVRFAPRVWGVQFHPEFDADVMRGYIEARESVLTDEGIDPRSLKSEDAPEARALLARFATLAR
jgi:GMP synthase (glutamine-hydrolysing)